MNKIRIFIYNSIAIKKTNLKQKRTSSKEEAGLHTYQRDKTELTSHNVYYTLPLVRQYIHTQKPDSTDTAKLAHWQLATSPQAFYPPSLDCKLVSGAIGVEPGEGGDRTHTQTTHTAP